MNLTTKTVLILVTCVALAVITGALVLEAAGQLSLWFWQHVPR